MLKSARTACTAASAALLALVAPVSANAQVVWTDWLSTGPGSTVNGSLAVPGGATVTYTGPYNFAQVTPGTDYWRSSPGVPWAAYDTPGAPTNTDFIQLVASGSHRVVFSAPVLNPYMAIISQGQPSFPVTYNFLGGAKFKVVDEGRGPFGDGWYQLDGVPTNLNGPNASLSSRLDGFEFHGIIQLQGSFSQLDWTSSPAEYWHGFTVGVDGLAPPPGVVPEPATVSLVGLGLFGVFAAARRRRR